MSLLTTKEVAKSLGVSTRRVIQKILQGHFPNKQQCPCDHKSWLIPESDLKIKEEKNV